jgi:ring-1,2-phenylacetyl-CoA epoxidase subunit PaaB
MPYEVHSAPGTNRDEPVAMQSADPWPMWEVFVRQRRGLAHVHAGSLHAPDAETAMQNARDVYTRRAEGVSVWVVPSEAIASFDPEEAADYYEANTEEVRSALHYDIPDEVGHM